MGKITFRWLGVAGMTLSACGQTLAIDTFFTRPPFLRLFFGRVASQAQRFLDQMPQASFILVSHSHYDHIMDVPALAGYSGAKVYASRNGCQLLTACGLPVDQTCQIAAGDAFEAGPFQVQVLPARHMFIPFFQPGRLHRNLHSPLRLRDYVMDDYFSFLIQVDGLRLLVWNDTRPGPAVSADVLFVMLFEARSYYEHLIGAVQPRWIVPIHWDDFFRPLDKPLRPSLLLPGRRWPPLGRINLGEFRRLMARLAPQAHFLVPQIFQSYELE